MNDTAKQIWIVTGASSGLGDAIRYALERDNNFHVENWNIDTVDLTENSQIEITLDGYVEAGIKIAGVVNCAGIAELNWFENIREWDYDKTFDINCKAIFRITKGLINRDLFTEAPTVVNVISTASKTPMTNSFTYCASKAAAEMMTRQMARELIKRHNITVFGIAPNKLMNTFMTESIDETVQGLRGWSAEQAKEYQAAGNGNLEYTDPTAVAEVLAFMLSRPELHKFQNGAIIPMGV